MIRDKLKALSARFRVIGAGTETESPERAKPRPGTRRRPRSGSQSPGSENSRSSRATTLGNGEAGLSLKDLPSLDGNADPSEIVWTWVTYEEDPTQGKDRPVLIIGRSATSLVAVMLTSKAHEDDPSYLSIGSGAWDPERRPSAIKLDRLLRISSDNIHHEGAILDRERFVKVVTALGRFHGWPASVRSIDDLVTPNRR